MKTVIRQSELSKITGASRQLIYKAISSGKIKVDDKRRVLLNDDLTQAWIKNRMPKKPKAPPRPSMPQTSHSIITQIELSRISGASKQVIYKAIKAKKIKVNSKRKVVFDNERTQAWLEGQIAKNIKAPQQSMPDQKDPEAKPAISLISLQREKLEQEIGKIEADKRLKQLQYQQKRDTLIEKNTVATILFRYLDALNINMLDLPEMLIDTILDKVSAGAIRGDIIKLMRDSIRKSIKTTKTQIKARLK